VILAVRVNRVALVPKDPKVMTVSRVILAYKATLVILVDKVNKVSQVILVDKVPRATPVLMESKELMDPKGRLVMTA